VEEELPENPLPEADLLTQALHPNR